jgi:hypothetical protein
MWAIVIPEVQTITVHVGCGAGAPLSSAAVDGGTLPGPAEFPSDRESTRSDRLAEG